MQIEIFETPIQIDLISLAVWALATWRISSLITRSQGPNQSFVKFKVFCMKRGWNMPQGGSLLDLLNCLWCISVWFSPLVVLALPSWVNVPLAVSALAMAIDPYLPAEDRPRPE